VTLITNRAVQAMGLQAIPSPFVRLESVGDGRGTTAKVPLLDIGGRVVTLLAYGIESIMSPLKEGDLASMRAVFPEVPTDGLVTAAGEVSLLVGQDNLSLFPVEKRSVGGAALYESRFGTGYIASGRPPRAKGNGADRHAEVCTAVREEHEPKEAANCPESPGEPPEGPVCDDEQTTTAGITLAQAIGGQGEAEACETPLPWEEEYDDTSTVEGDSRLDREVERLLWDSDLEDDEDYRGLQRSYRSWEHGYGANSGCRAAAPVATCGAARVMPAMSATQVHEEAAAETVETAGAATPSQTSRDVPAAKEEKLITGGVSANAAATVTDEERRAARKAAYLAMIADAEARRHAQLAAMKQRLPLAARLRRLWQDVGCTEVSTHEGAPEGQSDCGGAVGEGRDAPAAHGR
jgi:hypothetical protein